MSYNQWSDAWNSIIRNEIFQDEELKSLMKVPEGTSIIDFIDKYFIRAGFTNTVLTNQQVRVIYSDTTMNLITPNTTRNQISFDIYVKIDQLHNIGRDRLVYRTNLIANKLIQILTKQLRTFGYRFRVVGQMDLGTSAIGYARHNITFSYIRTY